MAPGAAETSTPALNRAFPQPSPALSPLAEQIAEITPERFRELLAQVLEDDALRHGLNLKEG